MIPDPGTYKRGSQTDQARIVSNCTTLLMKICLWMESSVSHWHPLSIGWKQYFEAPLSISSFSNNIISWSGDLSFKTFNSYKMSCLFIAQKPQNLQEMLPLAPSGWQRGVKTQIQSHPHFLCLLCLIRCLS